LAAQKFISEVAADALQYSKLTKKQPTKDASSKAGSKGPAAAPGNVLRMEDLTAALEEYGIDVKRPEFFV